MGQLLTAASSFPHRWVANGSAPGWSSSRGGFEAVEGKGTWMEEQPSILAPNLLCTDPPAAPRERNGARGIRAESLCLSVWRDSHPWGDFPHAPVQLCVWVPAAWLVLYTQCCEPGPLSAPVYNIRQGRDSAPCEGMPPVPGTCTTAWGHSRLSQRSTQRSVPRHSGLTGISRQNPSCTDKSFLLHVVTFHIPLPVPRTPGEGPELRRQHMGLLLLPAAS